MNELRKSFEEHPEEWEVNKYAMINSKRKVSVFQSEKPLFFFWSRKTYHLHVESPDKVHNIQITDEGLCRRIRSILNKADYKERKLALTQMEVNLKYGTQ